MSRVNFPAVASRVEIACDACGKGHLPRPIAVNLRVPQEDFQGALVGEQRSDLDFCRECAARIRDVANAEIKKIRGEGGDG